MAVSPARRQKPTSADETARVLRILDMLGDEIDRRYKPRPVPGAPGLSFGPDTVTIGPSWDLLAIADRIASRTED